MICWIIYVCVIYILLLFITPQGYYNVMPSWVPIYPNNIHDLKNVIRERNKLTPELVRFHKRTDPSVSYAFYDYLKSKGIHYPIHKLQTYITTLPTLVIIYGLKWLHNRKRPYQYDRKLKLESTTANTPSYPAGHTYQAFILAKILTKEYPQYSQELFKLAEKCNYVRIAAGLHYPSDGKYSKWLLGL